MKKLIRKILASIIISAVLLLTVGVIKVNAASASIKASKTTVTVGESVTITTTINAAAWEVSVSGGGITDSIVGYNGDAENEIKTKTYNLNTSTPGTYKVSISGNVTDASKNSSDSVSDSVTVTVKEAEKPKQDENTGNTSQDPKQNPGSEPQEKPKTKSGEYHLSSLSTSVGTLKPSFSTYNQDYTLEFPEDYDMSELKSIEVSAKATDSKARVTGTGTFEVKEGDNEIIVNCKAENGEVLAYRIKFKKEVKAQQSDLRLKTFSITRLRSEDKKEVLAKLNEEFKPDVFEYTMDVDEDTDELVLDYEIDEKFKEKITVEVTGNKDLKPGENIITITLTSKDDEKITTTYTIKVTKAGLIEEEEEVEEKAGGSINIKLVIIIAAVIVGLLLLALIILLIINHFQKKKAKAAAKLDGDDFDSSDKGLDDDNFDGGDRGFDADIGHDIPPVGVVEPTLTDDSSESNYDYLSREDEISEDIDEDEEEKRFGTGRYNTLRQNYNPDEDYAGFDDTDLPEGTVSEHMINAKLNGEAAELKKRYEIDELQEEIADELKDKKTKRKGRGRRYK